jgi:uncharacterized protein YbbK (DUF523 family)
MAVMTGNAKVVNALDEDVTEAFIKGARESLRLARTTGAKRALLKDRSPSCGLAALLHGADSLHGLGVTAAFLLSAGIEIIEIDTSEETPAEETFS